MDFIDYMKRINSMSLDRLMKEGNRLIARVQALDDKEKLIKLACQNQIKIDTPKCDNKEGIC